MPTWEILYQHCTRNFKIVRTNFRDESLQNNLLSWCRLSDLLVQYSCDKIERKDKRTGTHLLSAAAMLIWSMMSLTVSVICFALIVCCSNFVFTAECEIHSCEFMHTHTRYCDRSRHDFKGLKVQTCCSRKLNCPKLKSKTAANLNPKHQRLSNSSHSSMNEHKSKNHK